MSLNYNFQNVENYEALCYHEVDGETRMKPLAEYLIWALGLMVGIHEIREDNLEKFYMRLRVLWSLEGAPYRDENGEEYYPTFEDVSAFVGMHTNGVSMTDEEFAARTHLIAIENAMKIHPRDGDQELWAGARDLYHKLLHRSDYRHHFNRDLLFWLEEREYTKEDWPEDIDPEDLDEADEKFGRGYCLDSLGWPMVEATALRRIS